MNYATLVLAGDKSARKRFDPTFFYETSPDEIERMMEVLFEDTSWKLNDQRHWIKYLTRFADMRRKEFPDDTEMLLKLVVAETWLLRREIELS